MSTDLAPVRSRASSSFNRLPQPFRLDVEVAPAIADGHHRRRTARGAQPLGEDLKVCGTAAVSRDEQHVPRSPQGGGRWRGRARRRVG